MTGRREDDSESSIKKLDREDQMNGLGDKVDQLYEDMYLGRGKNDPPVTTRLDRVEQAIESMTLNSNQMKWALYAAIAMMLLNIISSHVHF